MKYNWKLIQKDYNSGLTWRQLQKKYGVSFGAITKAKNRGDFKSRNNSDAQKLSCKMNPRKHSEKTKQKISISRKKFLEENPDKIPYLLNHSSRPSYPERYFKKILTKLEPEYKVLSYSLDFADPHKKIDIEIDGEQHYTDPKIIKHDKKRNKRLKELGWKIIRIRWSTYKKLNKECRKRFISNLLSQFTD